MTFRALAALAVALASGCLGGADAPLGTAVEAVTECPGPATLQGIDVSEYQRTIDWNAVAASGRTFAIARVSDGFYVDPYFERNWAGMRAAGLVRGVYQFFRPTRDPVAQANILLARIGTLGPNDLAPVLDVEATDGVSRAGMNAAIHAWVSRVQAATGRAPIIYAGSYFWDDNVGTGDFAAHPLWLPAYGPLCPRLPAAWRHWTFHQYSSTGAVPGIAGNVDLDKFNGTLADLRRLAGDNLCPAHCEGSTLVGADCGRGDCAAFGSSCVADGLGARCVFAFCPAAGERDVCWGGSHIGHCVNGALASQGDCGVYGARCVSDAVGTRCVFALCPATGDVDICVTDSVVAHCHDGAVPSQGDCGAFGSRCVRDALGARCVFAFCPPTGEHDVCWGGSHVGHCSNGALTSQGDCAAYGAICSSAGAPGGRCVSVFCTPSADVAPVAHDLCWLQAGRVAHCDANGAIRVEECPAGQQCSNVGGSRCVPAVCPAAGRASVCLDARALGHCVDGTVADGEDCGRLFAYCSTAGAAGRVAARCVSQVCVLDAAEAPVAHDVCLPDGRLAHCAASGDLEAPSDCPAGTRCVREASGARCVQGAPPDAGTGDAGTGDAGTGDAGTDAAADAGDDAGDDAHVEVLDAAPGGPAIVDGGCGCRGAPARGGGAWACVAGLALALGARRRRLPRVASKA